MRPAPVSRDVALSLLGDPVRRAAYELVASQPVAATRARVADALGISRTLAAFHLDRLAEAGLLLTSFHRLGPKSGPGSGRPAKLYRRAHADLDLLIPPRHYDLAASVLADAVARVGAEKEAEKAARAAGRSLAKTEARKAARAAGAPEPPARRLLTVLRSLGYLPRQAPGVIRLGSCPFQAAARANPPVICGLNHALLVGVLEGCGTSSQFTAGVDPQPGDCCVVLRQRPDTL